MNETITLSFQVEDTQVKAMIQALPRAIVDEMAIGIDNSIKQIKDTINRDYKRMGDMTPSYLNPSASGLGFTDRTGALRSSIQTWIEERGSMTIGYVSAGTDYDKYVELLWDGRYSFMLPAVLQEQDYIIGQLENAIIRAISKV